jgi:long-chain acyl-CoA synthetase
MNVNYCLRRARRFHGAKTAIHHEDEILTWEDFGRRVEASARRMAALGVRKGDRVAVLMTNSPAYLDLYFSIPLLGALIVPMNFRWHVNEMAFTLEDSESAYLFVDQVLAPLAPKLLVMVPGLKDVLYYAPGDCPAGLTDFRTAPEGEPLVIDEPREDDLVGLFYTSGTTGGPKGAMLSHRNLYSNAIHALLPPAFLDAGARFLHAAPMFHLADAGAILALTLVGVQHSFLGLFDPEALMKAIERYRITDTILVPTMINMLIHHPAFGRYDLSTLSRVSYGASPMPLPLLESAMDKLKCQFAQGYGMTEVSPLLTTLLPEDHRLEDLDQPFARVKSAGKPILGVEVRVVDYKDQNVPVGQPGEIVARGPNVMQGYWKRPDISAEALRGGWMHTGDLGAFDQDGYLHILDRKKDMIKPGGENVYSPEVESVVCAHPAVLEAAVIGIADEKWGEAIRAVVALRPGASLGEEELIEWCRGQLTHFKCPTSVVFAEGLPKGGTGKIQKNALRKLYGGGASAQSAG